MADLVNPYSNPYLPSFVNQRPRITTPTPAFGTTFSQIHSVNGFAEARDYASRLANGSSEIISETDSEVARIYIVAKDPNGQTFMQPFRLIPEEEPKPVTMDDLNAKMSQLLERMNKLEEERTNDQSSGESSWNAQRNASVTRPQSNVSSVPGTPQSSSGNAANATK